MEVYSEPAVLSAGKEGILRCKVVGSNPSPTIKWFTHGKMINSQNQTVSLDKPLKN